MKEKWNIKLENQMQLKRVLHLLEVLGFQLYDSEISCAPTLLFTDEHGFIYCDHKITKTPNISLKQLWGLAEEKGVELPCDFGSLIFKEQPLFQKFYLQNGGDLKYLKWIAADDGTGGYVPDRNALGIGEIALEFDELIVLEEYTNLANEVNSQLMVWLECAKTKSLPSGYFVVPSQPTEAMLELALDEFTDLKIEDIEDRIVFAHQAMIQGAGKG